MVCPLCGKESEVGMFCSECFIKKNLVLKVPAKCSGEYCYNCETGNFKGKWQKCSEEKLAKFAVDDVIETNAPKLDADYKTIIDLEPRPEQGGMQVKVSVKIGKGCLEKESFLRVRNTPCPNCSRIAGGYFEAVIQLRGNVSEKEVKEIKERIEKNHKDRFAFVAEIKSVAGGFDIYLGSKKSAEKIVKAYGKSGAEVKRSHRQAGFDHQRGKAKHRFYYLIRIE